MAGALKKKMWPSPRTQRLHAARLLQQVGTDEDDGRAEQGRSGAELQAVGEGAADFGVDQAHRVVLERRRQVVRPVGGERVLLADDELEDVGRQHVEVAADHLRDAEVGHVVVRSERRAGVQSLGPFDDSSECTAWAPAV